MAFAIRVRSNSEHPLHNQYVDHEERFRSKQVGSLFAACECPDLAPTTEVFWVLAQGLHARILVYDTIARSGYLGQTVEETGSRGLPICKVLKGKPVGGMTACFSSLLPDDSGRLLLEYLQEQQRSSTGSCAADIKKLSWAWSVKKGQYGDVINFSSYNQYRPDSTLADLDFKSPLNRMDTFVVTVDDPLLVQPALDLLQEVLKRAPNQGRNVQAGCECNGRIMKPHLAADCEFVKVPRIAVAGKDYDIVEHALHYGSVEELCSVLTLAVGRHFTVMFNIVYMLEHANQHTVPALEALYRQIIFNSGLVKLWWNPQGDVRVLDETIAHMYQSQPRPATWTVFREENDKGRWEEVSHEFKPRWRITSPYFSGTRPEDLKFPKLQDVPADEQQCGLHYIHPDSLKYQGCPCHLGNIDIAMLLNSFCCQVGLPALSLSWGSVRPHFKYGDLLHCMLSNDRLAPLLYHMKSRAERSLLGLHEFYQSLGEPDMVKNDDAMAYNIGDVAGINLILEQLLASKHKAFLLGTLYAYCGTDLEDNRERRVRTYFDPVGMLPPRKSAQTYQGACGTVSIFVDNPLTFREEALGQSQLRKKYLKHLNVECGLPGQTQSHSTAINMLRTSALASWEHDQRIGLIREIEGLPTGLPTEVMLYEPGRAIFGTQLLERWKKLMARLANPAKLYVPEIMTRAVISDYDSPVLRAGATNTEALVEFLRSEQAKKAAPPPGFGAPPGSRYGLPAWLGRVPGQDMASSKEIYHAFAVAGTGRANLLSKIHIRANIATNPRSLRVDADSVLDAVIGQADNVWEQAIMAKRAAEQTIEVERRVNAEQGLPYMYDAHDVVDPEGREYRKRVEAAAPWNRPQLRKYYETGPDGGWKSLATVTRDVIDQKVPEADAQGDESWKTVGRKVGHGHVEQW